MLCVAVSPLLCDNNVLFTDLSLHVILEIFVTGILHQLWGNNILVTRELHLIYGVIVMYCSTARGHCQLKKAIHVVSYVITSSFMYTAATTIKCVSCNCCIHWLSVSYSIILA